MEQVDLNLTSEEIDYKRITPGAWDALVRKANHLLFLAEQIHLRRCTTADPKSDSVYDRLMGRYAQYVGLLTLASPNYIQRLHQQVIEEAQALEHAQDNLWKMGERGHPKAGLMETLSTRYVRLMDQAGVLETSLKEAP